MTIACFNVLLEPSRRVLSFEYRANGPVWVISSVLPVLTDSSVCVILFSYISFISVSHAGYAFSEKCLSPLDQPRLRLTMEHQASSPASTSPPQVTHHRSSITAQNAGVAVAPEVINSSLRDLYNITFVQPAANTNQTRQQASAAGPDIERIRDHLKSSFRRKYEKIFEGMAKRAKLTSLNKVYTELYITEGERGGLNTEHEIRQTELRTPSEQDKPINSNDIFKPLTNREPTEEELAGGRAEPTQPRTVLTVGIAGIGKTVSVQKFILDWAEGTANQDIDLLLVLPFRELNSVKDKTQSLHELLLDFHPELKDFREPKWCHGCRLLFIVDGLDESQLPLDFGRGRVCSVSEAASLDELVTNLIEGTLLPSALVWITSRLAAIDRIPPELIHRMTEVRGFTDPQKEEYFRKRVIDRGLADRIISHVKDSRTLKIMCHIPIFCWITATVLEHMLRDGHDNVPSSLTELYTRFLLTQTSVKRRKYSGEAESNPLKLSGAEVQFILKLGKLAFNNLQERNIVFTEEDLMEYGVDVTEASLKSGVFTEIVKEEDPMFPAKHYSFVHLSFQEYLAAVFVLHAYAENGENAIQSGHSRPASTMGFGLGFLPRLFQRKVTLYDLHRCAIDEALKSPSGHLDLFLRFLLGLSLESNQKLLKSFSKNLGSGQENSQRTVQYLKDKLGEVDDQRISSSERCINLIHCLQELNDHSMVEEIKWLTKYGKTKRSYTAGQEIRLANLIQSLGDKLDQDPAFQKLFLKKL